MTNRIQALVKKWRAKADDADWLTSMGSERDRLRQCASELADTLASLGAGGWQPIETAPHESGRFVIMADDVGQVAKAVSKAPGYWRWVSNDEPISWPQAWMPLPPSPWRS